MSVFGAAALVTEASPKPQLPRRVARGSSPRHPGSGSSFLHVPADRRRLTGGRSRLAIVKKGVEAN